MKWLIIISLLMLTGCETISTVINNDRVPYKTKMNAHATYRYENVIPKKLLSECNIGTPFSESVKINAIKYNIEIDRVKNINNKKADNYIKLEIIYIYAINRYRSLAHMHEKQVTIEATVYEHGQAIHTINRTRSSKGVEIADPDLEIPAPCVLLISAVETLGSDVAKNLNQYLKRRANISKKDNSSN